MSVRLEPDRAWHWLIFAVLLALTTGLQAANAGPPDEESLESVMEGFEEEAAPDASESLEEIITGFDDEVADAPAPRTPRGNG